MAKGSKFGQTGHSMRDSGNLGWHMGKANLFTMMVIFIMENGNTIKHGALGSLQIKMALYLKGNGLKISNKVKERRFGVMAHHT